MKRNRLRQFIIFIILVAVDIALFIALVKWFRWPLKDMAGFDIADYEDWYGELESTRVYRFGAGCCEYLYLLVKAALMIFLEKITCKKCEGSKGIFIAAVIIHSILLILGAAYVYRFLDGYNIFWLLRYFLTGAEPPF